MDVAVIGAGIGGLSAAIALRRQGERHLTARNSEIRKTAWSCFELGIATQQES